MDNRILIVGAGPTGLVMALWLAKSGVPFRIIEKNSGPGQASRAMAVQARTLEFYRQLGIADQAIASGIRMRGGHLRKGNRIIASFPFDNIAADISPFPFILSFPQDDHEHLLVKCLEAAGGRVEWNTQLVSFKEEGEVVKVKLSSAGKEAAKEEDCEFSYACGCDGARSTVRQTLGLGFPGGTYQQIFYVADVQAEGVPFDEKVNACITPGAFFLVFPVRSSGMFRLIGIVPPELNSRADVTFEDLRPFVKKQIDIDFNKVNWFSTYHVHHRVADNFRHGRVFIAGDAGHIHSPAGGQGMNTGIGDAVNLAWKLASVMRGRANAAILDTYEPERITFARTLVKTTDRLFQFAVDDGLRAKIARNILLRYVGPLALRFKGPRTAQFKLVSQTRINYRGSSALSQGTSGEVQGGDRLPWIHSQDNFQPLKSLDWQIHVCGAPTEALRTTAARWNLPVHSFAWNEEAQKAGFTRDSAYVVRPDGHIGLASSDQNAAQFEKYLSQWLQRPHSAGS